MGVGDLLFSLTFFVTGGETRSASGNSDAVIVVFRFGATALRLRHGANSVGVSLGTDLLVTGRAQRHFGHFAGSFPGGRRNDVRGLAGRRFRRRPDLFNQNSS